jgi:hypothetical protein
VTRTDVVASELSAPWFAQSFFGPWNGEIYGLYTFNGV